MASHRRHRQITADRHPHWRATSAPSDTARGPHKNRTSAATSSGCPRRPTMMRSMMRRLPARGRRAAHRVDHAGHHAIHRHAIWRQIMRERPRQPHQPRLRRHHMGTIGRAGMGRQFSIVHIGKLRLAPPNRATAAATSRRASASTVTSARCTSAHRRPRGSTALSPPPHRRSRAFANLADDIGNLARHHTACDQCDSAVNIRLRHCAAGVGLEGDDGITQSSPSPSSNLVKSGLREGAKAWKKPCVPSSTLRGLRNPPRAISAHRRPACADQPACMRFVQVPSARYSMMPEAVLPAMPMPDTAWSKGSRNAAPPRHPPPQAYPAPPLGEIRPCKSPWARQGPTGTESQYPPRCPATAPRRLALPVRKAPSSPARSPRRNAPARPRTRASREPRYGRNADRQSLSAFAGIRPRRDSSRTTAPHSDAVPAASRRSARRKSACPPLHKPFGASSGFTLAKHPSASRSSAGQNFATSSGT
jgi:hypothetical protein